MKKQVITGWAIFNKSSGMLVQTVERTKTESIKTFNKKIAPWNKFRLKYGYTCRRVTVEPVEENNENK